MPVRLPESLRRALGEEAAPYFVSTVQEIVAEIAVPRDEYRQVLSRLEIIEHDVAGVKADIADVKADVRDLRREMNERFDRMNERFDQMYDRMLGQTRWMVGAIVGFGTLITVLLGISQFTP